MGYFGRYFGSDFGYYFGATAAATGGGWFFVRVVLARRDR